MRRLAGVIFSIVIFSTGLLLLLLAACSSWPQREVRIPTIEGAQFVGNKSCRDCHPQMAAHFDSSPHGRWSSTENELQGVGGCESCHGPGSLHVQSGGGGRFIVNPGRNPEACLVCHQEVHMDFRLPHHHPVPEGKMNCVDCHDPHGREIFQPAKGLSRGMEQDHCARCHHDQGRPRIFEHEAMREGCTVCHRAHGSMSAKLLTERDSNLCLKCHAQVAGPGQPRGEIYIGKVPHSGFLRQGTCWSAGCHTAVHGSNVSPRMFY